MQFCVVNAASYLVITCSSTTKITRQNTSKLKYIVRIEKIKRHLKQIMDAEGFIGRTKNAIIFYFCGCGNKRSLGLMA
jgi:hypothetical protein